MTVEQGIGTGLATLAEALRQRRAGLLAALREVDDDLLACDRLAAAAERLGVGRGADEVSRARSANATRSVETAPTRGAADRPSVARPFSPSVLHPGPARTDDGPVLLEERVPFPGVVIPRGPSDYELRKAAFATLGPARDDARVPPMSERGDRMSARDTLRDDELPALRESVRGVVDRAAKLPPGPGGHGRYSAKGLMNGEPLAPQLRNILQAADRPMTSKEIAIALMQVRKVELSGPQLTAVVNRVGAILAQDVKPKRVARVDNPDSRLTLWVWAKPRADTADAFNPLTGEYASA